MNPEAFFQQLDERGKKMYVRFGPQPLMSNSRQAMEGGEFAREHDRYDLYHEAVFRAFFTDCRDIGDRAVILDVARAVGLDAGELNTALESGVYLPRLEETTREAKKNGISAAPTFVIDGYGTITGAQPIDTFRTALRQVGKNSARVSLADFKQETIS
jgi:predicted DsbA family dithiol-disulfide isomerase